MPKAFRARFAVAPMATFFAPRIRENTMNLPHRRPGPARALTLTLALCATLASHLADLPVAAAQYRLPLAGLRIGPHEIRAEVAATPAERERGLMQRSSMPENHGMLFVFEQPARYCFWMKNTLIPLTIAFIDETGRITNLADMQPGDEDNHHCPSRPIRMALEMNQGWFAARGLGEGHQVDGLPATNAQPTSDNARARP